MPVVSAAGRPVDGEYNHSEDDDAAGRTVSNVIGHYEATRFNESNGCVEATLVLALDLPEAAAIDARLRALESSGGLSTLGLSIDGQADLDTNNHATIHLIDSVDLVTHPAAGGRINRIAASLNKEISMDLLKTLRGRFPRLVEGYDGAWNVTLLAAHIAKRVKESAACAADLASGIGRSGDTQRIIEGEGEDVIRDAITLLESLLSMPEEAPAEEAEAEAEEAAPVAEAAPATTENVTESATRLLEAQTKANADALKAIQVAASGPVLERALESAKIPTEAIGGIVKQHSGKVIDLAEATRIAESSRSFLDLAIGSHIPPTVEITGDRRDRLTEALAHMFAPNFVKAPEGHDSSLFSLNRFIERHFLNGRNADLRVSEAWAGNSRGGSRAPRRRMKEAIDDTDFSNVFEDALYRALLATYQGQANYGNYLKLVREVPYGDFRENNIINVGYYGNLPAVAKGGTYLALTSPTDRKETLALAKKGGLETITWEDMLNDDLGLWQTIIQRIGQAAMETRFTSTLALIRKATQPTMADTSKLTDAGRTPPNEGVLALTADQAGKDNLITSITAMMQGTGNGGVAKGVVPKYLIIPFALLSAASFIINELMGGNTGSSVPQTMGVLGTAVPEVFIDYGATNATDWFLLAEPTQAEVLRFGTLGGNNAPDIFISDDNRFGDMFLKDQIDLKVRDVFQVAAVDPLGIYGNDVA
ncbi:hypothetical protein DRQ50_14695 [bacterium]|nr:MAG: hypothetical protein DRQ50_14695 [bacterium]